MDTIKDEGLITCTLIIANIFIVHEEIVDNSLAVWIKFLMCQWESYAAYNIFFMLYSNQNFVFIIEYKESLKIEISKQIFVC